MQFGLFGGARTKRGAGFEDSQGYDSFIDYVVEANWKLVFENNRECFHCPSNHKEYTRATYDVARDQAFGRVMRRRCCGFSARRSSKSSCREQELDRLLSTLSDAAQIRSRLETLVSVYPFNEYEFIISHLLALL